MNEKLAEAISLIESGEHEQGLKNVESLIPEADDETKRTIAELYFELGLVDQSLNLLQELMFRYPDHGELFAFAAECYGELGKEDEAIDMLNEVSKDDPAYVQARLLLADLYEADGLEEVAENKLLEALENEPDHPVLQFGLGEFYLNRGDYQKAISYYKKVVHQGQLPNDLPIEPKVKLAEAFSATGQFEEALVYFREGIEENETPDALFGYGYTAMQVEEYDTAVKTLTRLLEMDPDFTTAYPILARANVALKQYDNAMQILQDGIKRDEFNEELYLELAKLQMSRGEGEEGKTFLEKVIALNPSNVSAVKELLNYFDENEDYESVLELMAFLDDYREFDPLYERYRARALFEENETTEAAEALDRVLTSETDDERFLEDASEIYLAAGNYDKALPILKQLFELYPEREDLAERIEELNKRVK
ncbi:tetratricopeptide repeat protein [Salisediminibacterium halotolerans]|uniref:Tetratricopeptide repeat-containing protein n=1 Tax=Salisediminibacterium halotolerans TaxID=517425 RepID=A0A1H9P1W1_9BACI|nr:MULTISPECIES: tetratricopeptide repeat protein [Salisediminibacterium]RLJ77930.1 tetratricopeptide repeat protein [Actinophytocola xinjiangensis]RPE88732.1 tetratricopeptide repeat protein [Salisediminibacterium halotolerans]TWG36907.1 tetratricopeptide repeat protein [Salisediminibacterium halotolerans]SER42057.1 Tetratricopeptide repeat-containing protein [Salisediminibacterium haloalkalitolerans]GEL07407.1 TPR repeat-containing protein YpiA [Salisediminibacterium halotolerans]